jgi:predicted ArsR family transcriptional regulator
LVGDLLLQPSSVPTGDLRYATHWRRAPTSASMGQAADTQDPVPVLDRYGFEPRTEKGAVTLGNCPFHNLAQQHTELVCGMNLHLLEGLLDGLPCPNYTATLAPSPGNCCVVLERS